MTTAPPSPPAPKPPRKPKADDDRAFLVEVRRAALTLTRAIDERLARLQAEPPDEEKPSA